MLMRKLLNLFPKNTSIYIQVGHATVKGITEVCNIVKPKVIIPIHGENSHDFDKLDLPYKIKHLKNKETYKI